MKSRVLFFLIGILLFSCSPQKKLARKYNGVGREVVVTQYGEPTQEKKLDDGRLILIYRKETVIRPTPVSTGRFTLDPMISPGYLKIQETRFILNREGIVVETGYKEEIEK